MSNLGLQILELYKNKQIKIYLTGGQVITGTLVWIDSLNYNKVIRLIEPNSHVDSLDITAIQDFCESE